MDDQKGDKLKRIQRLRSLSHILDEAIAIPGVNYRVGIDPLIGLIPGGGDFFSALLSAYIVLEATRFGLPKETLGRMVINVLIDTFTGIIPVLGDLFDLTWKANSLNVQLLEDHLRAPKTSEQADRGFIIFVILALAIIVVGMSSLTLFALWALSVLIDSWS